MQKIEEDMWCFNCEHTWVTDDYLNCVKCPNCDKERVRIYRTNSFMCFYAMREKEQLKRPVEFHNTPNKYKEIDGEIFWMSRSCAVQGMRRRVVA